ncbi:MAG: phospholipase D family protein [Proteobacteria bacterium]|nr:phospholipase D family protein [Pseudomonadota bacterium]
MKLPAFYILQHLRACVASFSLLLLFPVNVSSQPLRDWVDVNCEACTELMREKTGIYILEKGEEALMGRAWLAQHAEKTIDIQYFIWSTDNIGTLAAEMLLRAAERGVTVRVLVDDFLIDAEDKTLLLLAAHPQVHIRIYNPKYTVGISFFRRIANLVVDFRETNQRMHDKTAIFDGLAGITGGRNMADEYFDFDQEYNFRDRDILLLGPAVQDMSANFNEFWESSLAVPVAQLLGDRDALPSAEEAHLWYEELHAYASDPRNFEPAIRTAIEEMPRYFPKMLQAMVWEEARFISDKPGKNTGESGLAGGGTSTQALIAAIKDARHSILIQSPYLILPKDGIELFADLHERGVRIRISTNSLASTDNLEAFSGYHKQRNKLLDAGIELYEYKPHPQIQVELIERYPQLAHKNPIFALHAKSMVIDDSKVFIGTFNLDPRSANLNTEVGVLVDNLQLGEQLTKSIERDIRPENSWRTTASFNPDKEVSRGTRFKLRLLKLLPIDPIL